MNSIQLDANNNIVIVNKRIGVVSDIDASAQNSRTRISMCLGEDPFAPDDGIDWFSAILGKMGGVDYIIDQIRSRIMDSPDGDIVGVGNITLDRTPGNISVTADIQTIYGGTTL